METLILFEMSLLQSFPIAPLCISFEVQLLSVVQLIGFTQSELPFSLFTQKSSLSFLKVRQPTTQPVCAGEFPKGKSLKSSFFICQPTIYAQTSFCCKGLPSKNSFSKRTACIDPWLCAAIITGLPRFQ